MPIEEDLVAAVVAHTSERMKNNQFAQIAVGNFVQHHPDAAKYITATLSRQLDAEAAVHGVFHAELICECFRRKRGLGKLTSIGFAALDEAASGDPIAAIESKEPALASYIASNVDSDPMRRVLAVVTLALRDSR